MMLLDTCRRRRRRRYHHQCNACAPDSGDDLVAMSLSAAQRACTLIHKRAIGKACNDNNWKLAVKILKHAKTGVDDSHEQMEEGVVNVLQE